MVVCSNSSTPHKMLNGFLRRILVLSLLLTLLHVTVESSESDIPSLFDAKELLHRGDTALSNDNTVDAIAHYEGGIAAMSLNIKTKGPSKFSVTSLDHLATILSLHTNLASSLTSEGSHDDPPRAIQLYQTAIKLHSSYIGDLTDATTEKTMDSNSRLYEDCHKITAQSAFYLGMTFHSQTPSQLESAVQAYQYAISLDPYHWSAHANLGALYHDEYQNPDLAVESYQSALDILLQRDVEPTDAPPHPEYIWSQLYLRIGLVLNANYKKERKCARVENPSAKLDCRELAAHSFQMAVKYDGENENARHMLASVTADGSMKRASNDYVTELFDVYASNFETSLVSDLGYNGYSRLRHAVDRAFGGNSEQSDGSTSKLSSAIPPPLKKFPLVIDAGCGTGLVGEQFRNMATYMIGADLSEKIVDEAKNKRPNLYNEYYIGDFTELFRLNKSNVDLIVSADAFIYFGDLVPLFQSMDEALKVGGFVAFTLESVDEKNKASLDATKPDWRWQLTPSGRFAHRKQYIVNTGKQHHLKVFHYETLDNFRHENGVGVDGHVFVMQKIADSGDVRNENKNNNEL